MWLDLVKLFCPIVKVFGQLLQVFCYIWCGLLSLFHITVVFRCIMQVFFMCAGEICLFKPCIAAISTKHEEGGETSPKRVPIGFNYLLDVCASLR